MKNIGEKDLVLKSVRERSILYKQKYLYCLCGWGGGGDRASRTKTRLSGLNKNRFNQNVLESELRKKRMCSE